MPLMVMSDDADISSVSTIAISSNISFKEPATPKRSDARKKLKTRRKTKHCSVALTDAKELSEMQKLM